MGLLDGCVLDCILELARDEIQGFRRLRLTDVV